MKEKKLKLEHLAPYLPYELKIESYGYFWNHILTVSEFSDTLKKCNDQKYKWRPILRPLSDLTKEIEHNGEKFVPLDYLIEKYYTLPIEKLFNQILEDNELWIYHLEYLLITHLFEWHFDVFQLIPEGLAIDINKIK